jgi:hypothetical protein
LLFSKLPSSDRTPAVEVNLTVAQQRTPSQEMPTVHLTEINLNDNQQLSNNPDNSINVNLIPMNQTLAQPAQPSVVGSTMPDYTIPPASELPSYNEALRLKKQEANEIPPSYYPTVNTTDARIVIDESDVEKNI